MLPRRPFACLPPNQATSKRTGSRFGATRGLLPSQSSLSTYVPSSLSDGRYRRSSSFVNSIVPRRNPSLVNSLSISDRVIGMLPTSMISSVGWTLKLKRTNPLLETKTDPAWVGFVLLECHLHASRPDPFP